jgi:hydroxymethylpyrimidine/phosphomethylpyrimidine kinase
VSAPPPRILVIAGSDSSGGAGIQADIKTITMLGGYAMTAITAVTAQNTLGVTAVEVLAPDMVAAQIDACVSDIGFDAVKIGMLGSAEIANVVADRLVHLAVPIVFDPVMVATSGAELADSRTIQAFTRLLGLCTVATPNAAELAALAQFDTSTVANRDQAIERVMDRTGCKAVLVKGGDAKWGGADQVEDYLTTSDHTDQTWTSPRIATRHTHGTGCTLASAIATYLGDGLDLPEAVRKARDFVRSAILAAPGFGAGSGPMGHQAVRLEQSTAIVNRRIPNAEWL